MQIQYLLAHLSAAVLTGSKNHSLNTVVNTSTPFFYSSINRLYAQNPVFEMVREESVKVCLHMHNGNVQQNLPCIESCVANGFSISHRLSPTMFDPDANSVLIGSMRRTLCSKLFMVRA